METTYIRILRKSLFTLLLNGTEIISFNNNDEASAAYATAVAIDKFTTIPPTTGCRWQLVLTETTSKATVNKFTRKVLSEEELPPVKTVLLDTKKD